MKKITKVMALLLAVIMVFAGCAKVDNSTVIYSNGGAKVTSVMDLNKAALDKALKDQGYNDPEAYLKSSLDGTYYEIVTIDGTEYYEVREIEVIEAGGITSSWNYYGLNLTKNGTYITKDTVYGVTQALTASDKDNYDSYSYMLQEYKALGFDPTKNLKITMSFEFPANITATNGTIDKANAKKVTFNIDVNKKNTIFATTNSANTLESVKKKVNNLNAVKKPKIKSLKINKLKKKTASVTLTMKKQKGVEFEIEYSTSKKFKESKTSYDWTVKSKITLKNLKRGKKYYVRVRASKYNYADYIVYSKYSKVKSIKIPKKK